VDETTELLKAVLFRLEELSAKIDGMDKRLGGVENHMEETNRRLSMIEQRLDYYRDKWMEHDEEIWVLKRRQA
jgi:chromosome segregation ATPase